MRDNGARHGVAWLKRDKLDESFGQLDPDAMLEVERCLAVFLGIAK